MQMHRKSGRHKIHAENSEKWVEDVWGFTTHPHLYNLQATSRLKICSLREAGIEEN